MPEAVKSPGWHGFRAQPLGLLEDDDNRFLEKNHIREQPRREKAGGRYATGLLLQLPARVRFRCDSMT